MLNSSGLLVGELLLCFLFMFLIFLLLVMQFLLTMLLLLLSDILGPPGSGVEWLRYIIEQLTGFKTGSTLVAHPEIFAGEGHITKVPSDVKPHSCLENGA